MSLQRVFETSRRLGIPVIVTDPAGRDPMVVLPLEHFEALAGSSTEEVRSEPIKPLESTIKQATYQPEPAWEEPPMDKMPQNMDISSEIAPEERFYLEPVEDGMDGQN